MQAMWRAKQQLHPSQMRQGTCIWELLSVSPPMEAAAGQYFLADAKLCMRRVLLTPHVAGVTELSYKRMAQIVAIEARRMRSGLPPSILLNSIIVQ